MHVLGTARHNVLVDRRAGAVAIGAALIALLSFLLALVLGDFPITSADLRDVLSGQAEPLIRTVVLEWRLPRALAALVFGAALAVSGAIFQTMTRNPLASPDIMGLANGSYTGMILALLFLGPQWHLLTGGALSGGLLAAAVIYLLALRDGLQGFRFIIIGIGVSAMLASANTWLLLRVDVDVALMATAWGAGTLNGMSSAVLWPTGIVILILMCCVPALSGPLRQLSLGDDAAAASGAHVRRARIAAIAIAVGLVSAVTAVAGPIAFIALSAPQISRRLARTAEVPMVATALVGAVLLLGSDIASQHVISVPIPVGVVTVVLGGMYLVWLLIKEARKVS
ncbi:iron complex transport system permease protein [Martelella mangrovi]|uniref:Iron complex transport system permease protein n=1 Tax=Martelella mangrovi TaxID=1397477 RepID=A0ABV2IIJ7_9HYPH